LKLRTTVHALSGSGRNCGGAALSPASTIERDIEMAFHNPHLDTSPSGSRLAPADPFTALERRVISLARHEDAVATPVAARGWRRVAAWFRTPPVVRPLASERLEALRRLASDLWHGRDATGSGNLALFRAAGFDDRHLDSLQVAIGHADREAMA
jgi:hypothetical protein